MQQIVGKPTPTASGQKQMQQSIRPTNQLAYNLTF
jgi:hypothetical protein